MKMSHKITAKSSLEKYSMNTLVVFCGSKVNVIVKVLVNYISGIQFITSV